MASGRTDEFFEKFNSGHLVFFAGSGISFLSNLPTASEILGRTTKIFLPSYAKVKIDGIPKRTLSKGFIEEHVINHIEPEVLYEKLLWLNNEELDSLGLWKSLSPVYWSTYQKPTLTHFVIAAYSIKNKVPVLTTNFDLLFESAFEQLKILSPENFGNSRLEVVLTDHKSYSGLKSPIKENTLRLIKLHGTITNEEGNELKNIMTTLTSITVTKLDFLEYLKELMKEKFLSIVGYSGGDIDLLRVLL